MSHPEAEDVSHNPETDPVLDRLVESRKPGELESGMLSGSEEGQISATERFKGEVAPEEALEVLDPEHRMHQPPSEAKAHEP